MVLNQACIENYANEENNDQRGTKVLNWFVVNEQSLSGVML